MTALRKTLYICRSDFDMHLILDFKLHIDWRDLKL